MKLIITIEMTNEAFGTSGVSRGIEVRKIMNEVVDNMSDDIQMDDCFRIRDSQGVECGIWDVSEERRG